eukprot:1241980-Rhodomonas_salina.3
MRGFLVHGETISAVLRGQYNLLEAVRVTALGIQVRPSLGVASKLHAKIAATPPAHGTYRSHLKPETLVSLFRYRGNLHPPEGECEGGCETEGREVGEVAGGGQEGVSGLGEAGRGMLETALRRAGVPTVLKGEGCYLGISVNNAGGAVTWKMP